MFFSMMTSLLSWGLGLIFGGILVREIVKNVRGIDYRAIGAAAFLGNGSVWALGLSSSAALVMATPGSIPPALLKISGVIPLSLTIYTWQSAATAAILTISSVTVAYLSTPAHSTKDAESFGVTDGLEIKKIEERKTPAEWLEYAPGLSIVVAALGLAYIAQVLAVKGPARGARFEYLQSFVPDDGAAAALEAAVFRSRGKRFRSGDGGRTDSIPVLWRNFRNHHVFHACSETGALFCELFLDEFVSDSRLDLFGDAGNVCAFRREQMDY